MLPGRFDYVRPANIQETLQVLSQYGDDGKLLAGGQSLIPLLKLRFAQPSVLIDVNRVSGLDRIELLDGELRIGAMTRQATLAASPMIREHAPAMAIAAGMVADPIIRNWGTIGGS